LITIKLHLFKNNKLEVFHELGAVESNIESGP